MRLVATCALLLGAALPAATPAAFAASVPSIAMHSTDIVANVGARRQRLQGRDCTPYNGPFGFYGNIWCQPPNVRSYMRNLSSSWPQKTPPALRDPKPDTGSDW